MASPTFDFSVFDQHELVTYAPLVGAAVNDVTAVRRPLTQSRQRNVERYVTLQVSDVIFHLEGTPLTSTSLAVGDTITDANSNDYSVVFVERQSLDSVVVAIGRPV